MKLTTGALWCASRLNSPHNPTGHVASASELSAIAEICVEHDLIAVADEVYEHCVFGGEGASGGYRQLAAAEVSDCHRIFSWPSPSSLHPHLIRMTRTESSPKPHLILSQGMRERTITLGSGGKLFSLTGWRVAWAVGPAALVGPLGAAHTHMTFSAPTPLQAGVAAALDSEDGLAEIAPLFAENFERLSAALSAMTMKGGAPGVKSICAAQGG